MKRIRFELGQISPFSEMQAGKRKDLENSAESRDLRSRDVLFEAGAASDKVYFLLTGGLKLIRKSADKRTYIADFISPNTLFGFTAPLVEAARGESAVAVQPSTVLSWPADKVIEAIEASSASSKALVDMLANQVLADKDWLEEQAVLNLRARLIHLIHRLARDFGQKVKGGTMIDLKVTHQDLADHLGASRESVTVTISALRRQKLLRLDVRKIVVPDMRALLKA